MQRNFFYIVNLGENSLHDINADDNGAYTQIRNTSTKFYCNDQNVRKTHYNEKVLFNTYQKIYVSKEDVIPLHRQHCKAKNFPLKRIVVTISNPTYRTIIPYAEVLYEADLAIKETFPVLCHSNRKKESALYIRAPYTFLSRRKDILKEGASLKEAYDNINSLPTGIVFSK